MAKCGAGECDVVCENGCGCISSSDEPESCECRCFGGTTSPKFGVLSGVNQLTKINVTFRGARASEVAVALSQSLRVSLAIPTPLLNKRLNVRWKKMPIRTVIKRLGLVEIKGASTNTPRKRSR